MFDNQYFIKFIDSNDCLIVMKWINRASYKISKTSKGSVNFKEARIYCFEISNFAFGCSNR